MKAVVNTKMLWSALTSMSAAQENKSLIPVLENVKLVFSETQVTLTLSNLNLTIIRSVPANVKEPFTTLVPYGELNRICGVLADAPMVIETKTTGVVISCNEDVFKIGKTDDAKDYPPVPLFDVTDSVKVDGTVFFALNAAADFALPSHMNMENVCLNVHDGMIDVVGLNGQIMYISTTPVESKMSKRIAFHYSFVEAIKKFQEAELFFSDRFLKIVSEDTEVIIRVSEAGFLNYEHVIKNIREPNCTMSPIDLYACMNKIMIYKPVLGFFLYKMSLVKGKAVIEFVDTNKELRSEIAATHDLKLSITFNAKFTKTVLSNLPPECDSITLSIADEKTVVFVKPVNDPTTTIIITPVYNQPTK